MKRHVLTALVAAATPAAAAAHKHRAHVPGCASSACDSRIGRLWSRHHPRARKTSAIVTAVSTSYCPGSSGTTMADGTPVRFGSVAQNTLPLGTRIRLIGQSFMGARDFVVRDRIGSGSQLDFWAPSCSESISWGRRTVRFVVVG
jgi:3D (Asp-Asp-Asp) domain-containing protein